MTSLLDRVRKVVEACHTATGFGHPNLASWEEDALISWMNRDPLEFSARELAMLQEIERMVL